MGLFDKCVCVTKLSNNMCIVCVVKRAWRCVAWRGGVQSDARAWCCAGCRQEEEVVHKGERGCYTYISSWYSHKVKKK